MPPERLSTPLTRQPSSNTDAALPSGSRWPLLCVLVSYMVVVFAVSHIPGDRFPRELARLSDKALHSLEYLPLGFLWARVVHGTRRRRFFLGWVAAIAFAVSDEIHQAFVPGRNADWLDVLADMAGSALGALLCVGTWHSKKKKKNDDVA